jgi:hypothetical protein
MYQRKWKSVATVISSLHAGYKGDENDANHG